MCLYSLHLHLQCGDIQRERERERFFSVITQPGLDLIDDDLIDDLIDDLTDDD
jgi:hypothetical protein